MSHHQPPNASPGDTLEDDTLDLSAIPGVRSHFDQTGVIPILVFRSARAIRVVVNPFAGAWRMFTPHDSRCLLAGTNTFPQPFQVNAGDKVTIVPIMSAVFQDVLRVQVPSPLPSDTAVVEAGEDDDPISSRGGVGALVPLESLPELPDDALDPKEENGLNPPAVIEAELDDEDIPTVKTEVEPASLARAAMSCGWHVVSPAGGVA